MTVVGFAWFVITAAATTAPHLLQNNDGSR
jgi:hypothetical protein